MARLQDAEDYVEHLARHIAESGRDGSPIFAPFESGMQWRTEGKARQIGERWLKPATEVGWERSWIVRDHGRIVAHLDIGCDPKTLPSSLHRATLSMGIEAPFRGQGLGRELMTAGLEWARAQAGLEWLELEVFRNNEAAHHLYLKFGFKEVGRTVDRFRVGGRSIDDLHLTLRLR